MRHLTKAILLVAALGAGASGLMAAARRVTGLPGAEWRLAVVNIHRPGATTPGVVLSLGLGISVLVAVALVERPRRGLR